MDQLMREIHHGVPSSASLEESRPVPRRRTKTRAGLAGPPSPFHPLLSVAAAAAALHLPPLPRASALLPLLGCCDSGKGEGGTWTSPRSGDP
ncbi:hypothetical protein ZWY2020_055804 [Hordeum vulgare]|nr:hypothetical protein ZWY2020_055804 [Hordeum vulgare]